MLVFENMIMKEVPESYCGCSVCGEYKDISSFNDNGGDFRTRTNCKECCELPFDDMIAKKEATKKFMSSYEYRNSSRKFQYYKMIKENTISKTEYINMLKSQIERLETELPDDILIGEYSNDDYDGSTVDVPSGINFPLPRNKSDNLGYDMLDEMDGKKVYYIS